MCLEPIPLLSEMLKIVIEIGLLAHLELDLLLGAGAAALVFGGALAAA